MVRSGHANFRGITEFDRLVIAYLLDRLINGLLILFGVVSVVFLIFNLKPGDPARMLADQRGSEEALANIRKDLGLDLSVVDRYLLYLNDLSPMSFHRSTDTSSPFFLDKNKYDIAVSVPLGDMAVAFKTPYLRRSYRSRRNVTELLAEAFPTTAVLALTSILMALILGVTLGTWSALNKGSAIDSVILGGSAIGMSGPSFFMAVLISWLGGFVWYERIPISWPLVVLPILGLIIGLLVRQTTFLRSVGRWVKGPVNGLVYGAILAVSMIIVGVVLDFSWMKHPITFPGTGLPTVGSLVDLDPFNGPVIKVEHLVLPAITLGIRPLSVVVQLTRSSLLEALSADHVRTARAKGLAETRIILNHGLRNALIPVVTTISGWLASLLAGAVFVEYIFGWRGLGLEVFNALENEDFPVVMGAVLLFSTIFVLMNMLVDLVYGVLDPRVRTI